MGAVSANPSIGLQTRSGSPSTPKGNAIEHCRHLLNDLLETDPADFGSKDLALLNLLCAPSLPGSENLDIPSCLTRLDDLTAFV